MANKQPMKGSVTLSSGLFLAGISCLAITAAMNRQFGHSQAASAEGQQLLGTAAIVLDVAGLVLFGLATGALFAAKKRLAGMMTLAVMMACAVFSIMSIVNYVASERLSVARAREDARKLVLRRQVAQEKAEKDRADREAALREQQLKWLQGQTAMKGGKKMDRKDLLDNANKLINDAGRPVGATAKSQDAAPGEITVQVDAGAEMIADFTGTKTANVQLIQMAYLAILLIVLKACAFPLAAFFWPRKAAPIIDLPAPLVRAGAPLPSAPPQLAIEGPEDDPPPPPPSDEIVVRDEPSPEGRAALDAISFPALRIHAQEPLRPQDTPDESAKRFLQWMAAYNIRGTGPSGRLDLTPDQLDELYREFTSADHREPNALRLFKQSLESKRRHVEKSKPRPKIEGEARQTLWHITPPRLKPLAPAEPSPEPEKPTAKNVNVVSIMSRRTGAT